MSMTKEEFEKAVREECPPQALPNELANLDQHYKHYLEIDSLFRGKPTGIGYLPDEKTGGVKMAIGTPGWSEKAKKRYADSAPGPTPT